MKLRVRCGAPRKREFGKSDRSMRGEPTISEAASLTTSDGTIACLAEGARGEDRIVPVGVPAIHPLEFGETAVPYPEVRVIPTERAAEGLRGEGFSKGHRAVSQSDVRVATAPSDLKFISLTDRKNPRLPVRDQL